MGFEEVSEPAKSPCDVSDVLCQLRISAALKSLQEAMGEVGFEVEFPELAGLSSKLPEKIARQEITLQEALAKCGNSDLEFPREITVEETEGEDEGD